MVKQPSSSFGFISPHSISLNRPRPLLQAIWMGCPVSKLELPQLVIFSLVGYGNLDHMEWGIAFNDIGLGWGQYHA